MRDLGSLTFDGKYLYIANLSQEIVFLLGDDFVPTASTKSVTISKDLITIIKTTDYENSDNFGGEGWFICACNEKYVAVTSLDKQGTIMANELNGFNVLKTILTAWDNGNESVTITVSWVVAYPTWNLTSAITEFIPSTQININFTVKDDNSKGYSFSANTINPFFTIRDAVNSGTTIEWMTSTGGTSNYILAVRKNSTQYTRYGKLSLVYQDLNGNEIKNDLTIRQRR